MSPAAEYDGSTVRDEREEDLFTAIGKRVQNLEINDHVNIQRVEDEGGGDVDDRAEARVTDVIESLCMNCHKNVSPKFNCLAYSPFLCQQSFDSEPILYILRPYTTG